MNTVYQFMAEFTMPDILSEEFMELLPYQRAVVHKLFSEGQLANYALSYDNAKIWAIFNANSEMEVMEMIADFPIAPFLQVDISLLDIYNFNTASPVFSLN